MKVDACLFCGFDGLTPVAARSDGTVILRCGRCDLMMVDTLNDDTESMYTREYFEKQTATKQGYTNYLSMPAATVIGKYAFARLLANDTPGTHLDLGCADGSLMEVFAAEGYTSRGLEISKDAVAIAKDKGLDVRYSRLHDFPSGLPKSQLITAFDLLEHADRPGAVLKAVWENLEDGGYFIFSTLSVRKLDTTEYWFNNSLEHYVYYNRANLTYILGQIFGENSFAFIEETTDGAAEFWGVARKGAHVDAASVLNLIASHDFNAADASQAFLLSLYYNQVSRYGASRKIIKHFESEWTALQRAEASFYHYLLQGKLEKAIGVLTSAGSLPADRPLLWQAAAYAQAQYALIRQDAQSVAHEGATHALREEVRLAAEQQEAQIMAVRDEYNAEILDLRSQLFKTRDELHALKNSRVVGRIIKARTVVGDSARQAIPAVKRAPGKGLYKTRKAVAKVLPPPLSRAIMRVLRGTKRRLQERQVRPVRYEMVTNQPWDRALPLVSVIIPNYNRADTIDETLDSLADQTFRNFEVIIVDDGSAQPESIAKLQEIRQDLPGLQIIRQKNQGVAAARNNGIHRSRGRYVICLDSDDLLDRTFIEKAVTVLESDPEVSLITSHQDMFGVMQEMFVKSQYDPINLFRDNMVITAAAFRREAWEATGGYKSGIGYEDWEFWLNMAEHGFWGKLIPEPLFKYRVALQSRYVDDKDVHWNNMQAIRSLHPRYVQKVRALQRSRAGVRRLADAQTALVNLSEGEDYTPPANNKPNVLIAVPWMTFGGAETLIYNFCREIKDDFNMSFITGLKSEHEWEYKFREISPFVYHLANLFEDERLYMEFVSQYIATRKIDLLHIIHTGFVFEMLPELKRRHPQLKVIVTVFNDRAPYFKQSIGFEEYIDSFTSDNQAIGTKYKKELTDGNRVSVIPNGIDCINEFNQQLFDRSLERHNLGVGADDIAVFYVGRLSEEKNPDVFLRVAKSTLDERNIKNIKFFVIGDGPMKLEVDTMLHQIKSHDITYLGYQPSHEVARYLSASDIFVLPSKVEGFPLSILEAMAMRAVVIASDVGAIADVIKTGECGYVVRPGDSDEITKIILALNEDKQLMEQIKSHARSEAENKYTLAAFGGNYKKLYDRVLSKKDS